MAALSKYIGLCETCDQDAVCTLKRSSRLEIIYCEQFSPTSVENNQAAARESAASSDGSQRRAAASHSAKRMDGPI
jgi:hypothetical protein